MLPLKGMQVLEIAGLAPAPFCGMLLSDFGARVVRVDRPKTKTFFIDRLNRGKEAVALDYTHPEGRNILLDLCRKSDALIDPFRPGAMEAFKLGPKDIKEVNEKLVYARLSGYGQKGPMSSKAGHDINYLSLSGVLSKLGPDEKTRPKPPLNLLGDFGGGGLLCAFGILAALISRMSTGKGAVLDANITDGTAYLSSWLWRARDLPVWGEGRGNSWFDGGLPYYDTYECKDGTYVAVGCLEKPFFDQLLAGLGIPDKYDQSSNHDELRADLEAIFKTKSREEWTKRFEAFDACVTPVLTLDEAASHPHQQHRKSFRLGQNGLQEPVASPRFLDIEGATMRHEQQDMKYMVPKNHGEHTEDILREIGYDDDRISFLRANSVIGTAYQYSNNYEKAH